MDIFSFNALKSNYMKADDLCRNPLKFVIESVSEELVGDEMKPVLHMRGMKQVLVLTQTNARMLSDIFGTSECNEWGDREAELYPTTTQFGSKTVPAIRVRAAVATPISDTLADYDDELPADL